MTPNVFIASVLTAFAWTLTAAGFGQPASSPSLSLLSDTEIRRILVDRIDVQRQSVGMVVGIVTPAGRRVVSYGAFSNSDARPVTGDSVFEIGSVTKVFTSWLLADMVARNEVRLMDPAARYLPAGMTIKSALNGRTITLVDLATHTAGLPFWPSNVPATGSAEAAPAGQKARPISLSQRTPEFQSPSKSTPAVK